MGEIEARHNCGLVVTHSLHSAYSMIRHLQHRGREATGIAAIGSDVIDVIKWEGPVSAFDLVDLEDLLPSTKYHTFFAHVRYATKGRKDRILDDAHPHTIGGERICNASHIIVRNADMAAVHNGQVSDEYFKDLNLPTREYCDTEKLLRLLSEGGYNEVGLMQKIPGSYTLAFADKRRQDAIIMRDRLGMMPGVLGKMSGKYVVASEDIAFRKEQADLEGDLEPGTIYYLHPNGAKSKTRVLMPSLSHCMFQYNYIGDRDSVIDGISVSWVRQKLGEALAREYTPDVDYITYLPRCPKVAATAYAEMRNLPFIKAFYKMRAERAFQGSTLEERANSISANLYINDETKKVIYGKKLLVVDDSTIRGNNATHAISLLKAAGIAEVHLANYTPKIGIVGMDGNNRGCDFGIDMPPDSTDFIARGRTDEEIGKLISAKIYFLSVEGMLRAFEKSGISRKHLCHFCIGGPHPFLKASTD